MPQTHCFPKQRDLRSSRINAGAKDLGQNQSFRDFIEEVQRFVGQQPSVVWFVCISSGNSQASEELELGSHDCKGHTLPPCKVGEERQGEPVAYKGLVSSPVRFSSGLRGLQPPPTSTSTQC